MLEQTNSFLYALFTLMITIGGAYSFIGIWENSLKNESLKRISEKILSTNLKTGTRKILELYLNLNSRLFGSKIFSYKSFTTSLALTSTWASLLIITYSITYPLFREWILNIIQLSSLRWIALWILIAVLLIDYASICLTRKIYRTVLSKGKKSFLTAFALDLFKSVAIYYVGITTCKLILIGSGAIASPLTAIENWLTPSNLTTALEVLKDFDMTKSHVADDGTISFNTPLETAVTYAFPEGVFFTTSLLTSLWLWIYIATYWLAYIALRLDTAKKIIFNHMNIEEKPLSALTALTSIVIISGFVINSIILLIIN
jgi:hypothetical protein